MPPPYENRGPFDGEKEKKEKEKKRKRKKKKKEKEKKKKKKKKKREIHNKIKNWARGPVILSLFRPERALLPV